MVEREPSEGEGRGLRVKAKVTAKGQITIPKAVRERLGLREGDAVYFVQHEDGLHVEPDLAEFDRALEKWRGAWRDDPEFKGRTVDEVIEDWRGR